MNSREAFSRLRTLGIPVVGTGEAAAVLDQSVYAASKTLARLASAGMVMRIRSGTWWIDDSPAPNRVAEYLTAPYPSYLSLHTALRLHGMVEQIPAVTYVVTLGRTQRIRTSVGVFSVHHIRPELFGGFEAIDGIKLATPEKALFDIAYLGGGRSRLKPGVPELELPTRFRSKELERWIGRVSSSRSKTLVRQRLERMLGTVTLRRRTKQ